MPELKDKDCYPSIYAQNLYFMENTVRESFLVVKLSLSQIVSSLGYFLKCYSDVEWKEILLKSIKKSLYKFIMKYDYHLKNHYFNVFFRVVVVVTLRPTREFWFIF